MSNINVSNSHPAGHELFSDPESYMTPLSSDETDSIHGGGGPFDNWGDVTGVGAVGASFAAFTSPTATPTSPAAVSGASAAAVGLSYQAVKEAYD
jgi:hypothetical protein